MAETLQTFARQLHKWGANVTAIQPGTKHPAHKWQHWQEKRQTKDDVNNLPWSKAAAVGVVNGSGDFRIFDIDAPKDQHGEPRYQVPEQVLVTVLQAIGLPHDYQWSYASGSGAGWGFVIRCQESLPVEFMGSEPGVLQGQPKEGFQFDHLELRWSSGQTVIDGRHPSGPGYCWRLGERPFVPPALVSAERVVKAFDTIAIPITNESKNKEAVTAVSPGHISPYGRGALNDAIGKVSTSPNGSRNNTLFEQTTGLAELVNGGELLRQDVEQGMTGAAMAAGLPESEIRATLDSAFKTVGSKARTVENEWVGLVENGDGRRGETAVSVNEDATFSTFADVDRLTGAIEWAWPGWLAQSYLHLLASESGVGKSFIAMRLAGCFLCGMPWPDGQVFTEQKGSVLWCEAEAAQQLNKERAKSLGLPLDKIIIPSLDPFRDIELRNIQDRDAIWSWANDDSIRFIVVDSLSGADPRDENSSDKLSVLKWLAELARNTGKPILLTHHLNKPLFGNETVTLNRLRGSTAIPQMARVIWAMDTPDPNNKEQKRLSVLKSNLAKFPEPIGVQIGTEVKFGPAPSAPQKYSELDRAMDFLRELLERQPVTAKGGEEAAMKAGISQSTLKRAKKQLGITSAKKADGWYWSLPVPM
ncbi:MAG: AAA family ATPase [Ardenticatenaceae bacterium]|nr:AAA family ATPase [Anaerolineales bacterium]MCB8923137.1 AAA family ATPase [Ardenticatenaceae bacterium]MCB9005214.1 AAA family ATPase [Ardenticatenaceae bacterium]